MKLIVGLGNPGNQYAKTRHNIGFMVADALAKELGLEFKTSKKYNALFTKSADWELLKPQTFMNNSGTVVQAVSRKHGIPPENILVIMDDLDMEAGKLRYRAEGSSGGHRGLQSVIDNLKTDQIARLKIGIGFPIRARAAAGTSAARAASLERSLTSAHVLGKFTAEQLKQIKVAIPAAIEIINKNFLNY
ncbi:MAG: aminoacyl-tRNA hydrolase [Patescibacteria group bacterium]